MAAVSSFIVLEENFSKFLLQFHSAIFSWMIIGAYPFQFLRQ